MNVFEAPGLVRARGLGPALGAAIVIAVTGAPVPGQPPRGEAPPGPPPASVRLGQAREQELQERWPVVGRLREVRRVVVSAEQEGLLVEVPIEEGQQVQGNQTLLARVEEIWARLALQTAEAQLEQARALEQQSEALLDQATRDRTYLDELGRTGSAKPKEVADAAAIERARQAALQQARAEIAEAQAEVQRRQAGVEKLRILAPFDGVVVRKMVEIGRYVERGSQIAEIISHGKIDAVIDVPETLINAVRIDQEIEVLIEPVGKVAQGTVRWIVPDASTAARTFPVKVRLDDQDGTLKTGMSVVARVPTSTVAQVLTVPRDAVLRSATGTVVWVNQGGTAMKADVQLLFGHEDRYAVRVLPGPGGAALVDGAQVVVEGGERLLIPGQPLSIVGAERAADAR